MSIKTIINNDDQTTPAYEEANDRNIVAAQILFTTDDNYTYVVDIPEPARQMKLNIQHGFGEGPDEHTPLIRTTFEAFSPAADYYEVEGDIRVSLVETEPVKSLEVEKLEEVSDES